MHRDVLISMSKKKMRRRSRMKTLKILRLFAQGRIVVFIMLFLCSYILGEPGYLDFDNLPDTNFSCAGKVIGGYYADLETSCQMFHVCTIGQLEEPMDIKFLCLNGTVFDQETRVCERVDEVDCTKSEKFYYLNLELYGNTMVPIPEEETSPTQATTTTTTSTTTTRKPVTTTQTTTTKRPDVKSTLPPQKKTIVSSTPNSIQSHFITTSTKSYQDDLREDEEYEYEDDYLTTDGKDLQNYQDTNSHQNLNQESLAQHVFSPEQFIYRQKNGKSQSNSPRKPAISFQQQQFQNGGSLTVTNSHVTVTTHTSAGQNSNNINNINKQFSSKPKEAIGYSSSSTTQKPQFSFYNSSPQSSPKRIALLPPTAQQGPPLGHPGLSQIPSFRLPAQGFRLPQQREQSHTSASPFEGYGRHMPQVILKHISLRLPLENEQQNQEILGFDDSDNEYPQKEHKDLKRSDPHAVPSKNITQPDTKPTNHRQDEKNIRSFESSSHNTNYDKVLLTLQDQYIPTLPKVIITASASVSDASGKKLNYSVGSVIGTNVKSPPLTYDEYKEDDVILDPFFLDVPKIKPRRMTRDVAGKHSNKIVKKKRKLKLDIKPLRNL